MSSAAIRIGTHDGTFHCDEALAVYLLRLLPAYKDSTIVRSRDPKVLETCDIVVDVGATYEPAKHRYDHHQRGFTETLSPNHTMKLSSAGLIYKHFGREVIKTLHPQLSEADLETIYLKHYTGFVEALDGIDNGVSQYEFPADLHIEPKYKNSTDLSARVGWLNPEWNEEGTVNLDERFRQAMELAGGEFVQRLGFLIRSWLPARNIVRAALEKRFDVHASGQILRLDTYTIWKSHLYSLESELQIQNKILYVLYQDPSGKWRVQCVSEEENSFNSRKPLPEPWRGIRDDALSQLSGIPGCIFVHANGFIGGTQTYESALAMAVAGIEFSVESNKKQKTDA